MKNNRREIFEALSWVSQLGLSVAFSFLLWILIAAYIKKVFSLGNFVMLIGIFLGIGSAGLSFFKFCRLAASKENKNEE